MTSKEERDRKMMLHILRCGHKYFDIPRPFCRLTYGKTIDKAIVIWCIKRQIGTYCKSRMFTLYERACDSKCLAKVRVAVEQRKGWLYDKYMLFEKYVIEELKNAKTK